MFIFILHLNHLHSGRYVDLLLYQSCFYRHSLVITGMQEDNVFDWMQQQSTSVTPQPIRDRLDYFNPSMGIIFWTNQRQVWYAEPIRDMFNILNQSETGILFWTNQRQVSYSEPIRDRYNIINQSETGIIFWTNQRKV